MEEQTFLTSDVLQLIEDELRAFRHMAKARVVFLIDRNGQLMGQTGDASTVDTTAMAALTASNVAASQAIAELIKEREFGGVFHEGEKEHIHISIVGGRAILVVLFDTQSSIGLVRLRVKKTALAIAQLFEDSDSQPTEEMMAPFTEISDDDIDQLFA